MAKTKKKKKNVNVDVDVKIVEKQKMEEKYIVKNVLKKVVNVA
jgi:hypothetical protein